MICLTVDDIFWLLCIVFSERHFLMVQVSVFYLITVCNLINQVMLS